MGAAPGRMQKLGNMLSASILTYVAVSSRISTFFLAKGVVLAARLKALFVGVLTAKSPDRGGVE